MENIYKHRRIEIWRDTSLDEYYVYCGDKLVRVCPSIGMAREVAEQAA